MGRRQGRAGRGGRCAGESRAHREVAAGIHRGSSLSSSPLHSQCDFLRVRVGPRGSAPVLGTATGVGSDATATPPETSGATTATEGTADDRADPPADEGGGSSRAVTTCEALPAASFNAAVLSLMLSYLPLAEQRALVVAKARALLRGPPITAADAADAAADASAGVGIGDRGGGRSHDATQLAHGGLLLIIEPLSIDTGHGQGGRRGGAGGVRALPYLSRWVVALEPLGLELVRYARLRRAHALAFRAVAPPQLLRKRECATRGATAPPLASFARPVAPPPPPPSDAADPDAADAADAVDPWGRYALAPLPIAWDARWEKQGRRRWREGAGAGGSDGGRHG